MEFRTPMFIDEQRRGTGSNLNPAVRVQVSVVRRFLCQDFQLPLHQPLADKRPIRFDAGSTAGFKIKRGSPPLSKLRMRS